VKHLIDAYGAACAARACAVHVSIGQMPPGQKSPLLLHAEEHERAARDALDTALFEVIRYVTDCVGLADDVRTGKRILRADDVTMVLSSANHRSGVDRYRQPNLKDAKRNAEYIARDLRKAWGLLDPSLP
jgi:hypothetical protein